MILFSFNRLRMPLLIVYDNICISFVLFFRGKGFKFLGIFFDLIFKNRLIYFQAEHPESARETPENEAFDIVQVNVVDEPSH